jgi:hypothetical protein
MAMQSGIWGIINCALAVAAAATAALVAGSFATGSRSLGLAGVVLCITTFGIAHIILETRWLKIGRAKNEDDRERIHREEIDVCAKRAILDNETHRATRAIEEQQNALRDQLAAEREEMLAEVEERRQQYKREGFQVGFEMGKRGVAAESLTEGATVIHLPVGTYQPTTLGEGVLHHRN